MKSMSIKLAISVILIFSVINVFAAAGDSIELHIRLPKNEIGNYKDLIVDIEIKSNKDNPWIFFKEPPPGYADRHMGALRMQVQKKIDDKYVDLPAHGAIDNLPGDNVDSLYKGNSRIYQLPLTVFFRFPKGSYRVRILAAFSLLNTRVKDQYSEWVYFNCKKDIVD